MKRLLILLAIICAGTGFSDILEASQTAQHAQVSTSSTSGVMSAALTALLLGGAYLIYNYPDSIQFTPKARTKPTLVSQSVSSTTYSADKQTELNEELLFAAKLNKYDDVKKALDAGADVNAHSKNGLTALMYNVLTANGKEVTKIIKLLIKRGADVNAQDTNGTTALMYAAQRTYPLTTEEPDPLVRTLVDAGADISITDNEGRTALEYLPETVTKLFTAQRKRYLRQEHVNQRMQVGTSQ